MTTSRLPSLRIGIIIVLLIVAILLGSKTGAFSRIKGELTTADTTVYERVRVLIDIEPTDSVLTKREMKRAMIAAITKVIGGTDMAYDLSENNVLNKNDLRLFLNAIQYLLTCGNGQMTSGEACDDGNTLSGNGCSAICTIEEGFNCTGSPSVCTRSTPTAVCGNGILDAGELCEDQNTVSGDGCSGTEANVPNGACQHEYCGDGYLDTDGFGGDPTTIEQCDDGGVCQGGPNDGNPCTKFFDDPACGATGTCMKINSIRCSSQCTLLNVTP